MDFWFYVSPYISNLTSPSFDSHEILWDFIMLLQITSLPLTESLDIKCYPGYQDYKPTTSFINDNSIAKLYQWNYIQCGANLNTNQIYLNYQSPSIFQFKLYESNVSSLKIRPGPSSKTNYGYLFIKEIKLWNVFDKTNKSTRCSIDDITKYLSYLPLLHYFKLNYLISTLDKVKDEVKGIMSASLKVRQDFFGYSVVNANMALPAFKMLNLGNCKFYYYL